MDFIAQFIHFILHLDKYLAVLVAHAGLWTYAILFLIIFCETGLVVTPLLPGDSLLFAAGSLAALSTININVHYLAPLLFLAAIMGDSFNYAVGNYLGPRVFHLKKSRFFNPEHLQRTHQFYEKHGGKTIIIARFVPIVRTFAPFVAGIGEMRYLTFVSFNVIGAFLWIFGLLYLSYFFGNIPIIKQNFSLVIMAIIFISLLPPFIEFVRHKRQRV